MKKSILFTVGICLVGILQVFGQDLTNEVTGFAKTGVQSEYLAKTGKIFSKSPISVNIVEADYKDFYGGIWSVTSLGGRQYGTTYGDEWDTYGGWSHVFGPIKLDISGTYMALAQLDKMRDDIWLAEQELSVPKMSFVQPYIRSRYYGSVDNYWKPGWFVFGGLRKSISFGQSFADRPFSLNFDASTAYSAGALHNFNGFVYGRLSACLDIPLSKRLTLSPNLIYQAAAPGQRNNPDGFTDGNKFIYGFMMKLVF